MPLLLKLLGPAFPFSHTRHYITRIDISYAIGTESSGKPKAYLTRTPTTAREFFDYDCWSELVFRDEQHFGAFYQKLTSEEVSRQVKEDEIKFVIAEKIQSVTIDKLAITVGPRV
ncbi:hypothetical protein BCON_0024g00040 [Botryotinia convoluta]|uniref:EthD domain-containing protein n=1 Tax=Botryotinia convoluta TaxID=54673 RepID=A0A4Z1IMK2_9HELO|nr:hypothetical protein BCON_0024g00040 [Botryotinia convoluta]